MVEILRGKKSDARVKELRKKGYMIKRIILPGVGTLILKKNKKK